MYRCLILLFELTGVLCLTWSRAQPNRFTQSPQRSLGCFKLPQAGEHFNQLAYAIDVTALSIASQHFVEWRDGRVSGRRDALLRFSSDRERVDTLRCLEQSRASPFQAIPVFVCEPRHLHLADFVDIVGDHHTIWPHGNLSGVGWDDEGGTVLAQ
jgi:hypothetical protein